MNVHFDEYTNPTPSIPPTTWIINKTIFSWITGCVFVGLLAGYWGYTLGLNNQSSLSELRLGTDNYSFINPLLDYTNADKNPVLNREVEALQNQIASLIETAQESQKVTNVSVYYRGLNAGSSFSINDEINFEPASLLKVPVMMAYFKAAEKNPAILQETITYTARSPLEPTHSLTGHEIVIEVGKTYTVEDLIERMIIHSDNAAAVLLVQHIEPRSVTEVFEDLAISTKNFLIADSFLGPREYAGFLRILYNSTYLSREYSEKALEMLSRSVFDSGIRAGVPEGTKVSSKYGVAVDSESKLQLHECGIIYAPENRPYLLCIMTTGNNYQQMGTVISDISSLVYKTVGRKD